MLKKEKFKIEKLKKWRWLRSRELENEKIKKDNGKKR